MACLPSHLPLDGALLLAISRLRTPISAVMLAIRNIEGLITIADMIGRLQALIRWITIVAHFPAIADFLLCHRLGDADKNYNKDEGDKQGKDGPFHCLPPFRCVCGCWIVVLSRVA